jgi:8-oxo-(d)GTP phosphatase
VKFYINDVPVLLTEDRKLLEQQNVDVRLKQGVVVPDKLHGKVVAEISEKNEIFSLLASLKASSPHTHPVTSLTIVVKDLSKADQEVKNNYELVEAAGGLVIHQGKFLLIHRLGKWDLPKGKLEKSEDPESGALREVEEECNVKVALGKKICDTWHTYEREGKNHLKKTYWYSMELLDDSKMMPQTEEDIEKVEWVDAQQLKEALELTYPSIRDVFKAYGI